MQNVSFEFLGRPVTLWTHPEPDHLGRIIHASRTFYEPDVLMKCREIYLPGTTIIDAGANIGNHAVFFGAILGAQVHAFEPSPDNLTLLAMNVASNRLEHQVWISDLALGACPGTATVHQGPAGNQGMAYVSFGDGETPVAALDAVPINGPVGLIKIDVEGAEVAVLQGATGLIRRWLPDIMIEAAEPSAFRAITLALALGTALVRAAVLPAAEPGAVEHIAVEVPRAAAAASTGVTTLSASALAGLAPYTQFARAAYCPSNKVTGWACGGASLSSPFPRPAFPNDAMVRCV